MRISEVKGDAALDMLADLIEPAAEIFGDKDVAQKVKDGRRLSAVKDAIKNHKKAVTEILAVLDGEDPTTYSPNIFTLPAKLIEVFNDPEVVKLFSLQGQTKEKVSSGSATENTEGDAI